MDTTPESASSPALAGLLQIKEVDRLHYTSSVRDFLPDELVDIHTHIWRASDFPPPTPAAGEQRTEQLVRLAIDLRDSFFRKKLATEEAQAVILEAAERVFGARPTMELVQGTLPDDAPSIARLEELARQAERHAKEAVLRAHPLVLTVCEVLNGEVAKVKLDGDAD